MDTNIRKKVLIVSAFVVLTACLSFIAFNFGVVESDTIKIEQVSDAPHNATSYSNLSVVSQNQIREGIGGLSQRESVSIWDPSKELMKTEFVQLDGDIYRLQSDEKISPISLIVLIFCEYY